eukprot:CFRG4066T1
MGACVLLAAGHDTRLEREIREDDSGDYSALVNLPKSLLPIRGANSVLKEWLVVVTPHFERVILLVNADKYKYFERFVTANGLSLSILVNDGTTSTQQSRGAVAGIELVRRTCHIESEDLMVVAADMVFERNNFRITSVIDAFRPGDMGQDVVVYYTLREGDPTDNRGILHLDSDGYTIVSFEEKPKYSTSKLASICMYYFRSSTLATHLRPAITKYGDSGEKIAFGMFIAYLIAQKVQMVGVELPSAFSMIGNQTTLENYVKTRETIASNSGDIGQVGKDSEVIVKRAFARVGLIGNPSDGFNGATIAVCVQNFWAEAKISASESLVLVPHALNDPNRFGSLRDLSTISTREGYQGGLVLMQATCKRFMELCQEKHVDLPTDIDGTTRNFRLSYDTNIPRQVGLSGSSAIVTAVLRCLMAFYGFGVEFLPLHLQPAFVLSVESELGITAGLQDRVIQTYEGVVYMDFGREVMKQNGGYGMYKHLDASRIPPIWLAYLAKPSSSGKMHSDVKQRWLNGDLEVEAAIQVFRAITKRAAVAIENGNTFELMKLMNENFDLRKGLYTESVLGIDNMMMINTARKYGSSAKFSGSGGAIIGICVDAIQKRKMRMELETNGCVFVDLHIKQPHE